MSKLKIVIVDDDRDIWNPIVRQYVESAIPGADIIVAEEMARGWELLTASTPPDLVIGDIMWPLPTRPGGNQTEVGRQLAQESAARNIPFIAITSEDSGKLVRDLFVRDRVADVFLKDDFQRAEFIQRIRSILKSRAFESPSAQQQIKQWVGNAPRAMVTAIFTDIVGSTELLNRVGNMAFGQIIEAHYAAGRELIRRHGGCEVNVVGDAFLIVVRTPMEALNLSFDLQDNPG